MRDGEAPGEGAEIARFAAADDRPDLSRAAVASRLRGHIIELRARLRTPSAAWSRESDRLGLAYAEDALAMMAENERSQAEIERAGLARRGERLQ